MCTDYGTRSRYAFFIVARPAWPRLRRDGALTAERRCPRSAAPVRAPVRAVPPAFHCLPSASIRGLDLTRPIAPDGAGRANGAIRGPPRGAVRFTTVVTFVTGFRFHTYVTSQFSVHAIGDTRRVIISATTYTDFITSEFVAAFPQLSFYTV